MPRTTVFIEPTASAIVKLAVDWRLPEDLAMTDMKAKAKPVEATPAKRRWFLGLPTWIRASATEPTFPR
jgi:hypothetical protein